MALSAEEQQALQGIERGIVAADPHLAARFAAFAGLRHRSTHLATGTYLLPMGRRRVPISRRWAAATVLALVAVEVLLGVGLAIGDMALVIAGIAVGAITVVAAGFAIAACAGSTRGGPATRRPASDQPHSSDGLAA